VRRLLTGLLGATLLLGACGDDGGDDRAAATSIPDETSTSSTTTEARGPPPDVIPRDVSLITEEYVEQVLDALYEVSLEAALLAREAGVVDRPTIELIEATSSETSALERINGLIDEAAAGFVDYQPDPRPVDAVVLEVVEASETCIFAKVDFDSSGMVTTPDETTGFEIFARLRAATEEQRASGKNPTAWVLDGLPASNDGSVPDGCAP